MFQEILQFGSGGGSESEWDTKNPTSIIPKGTYSSLDNVNFTPNKDGVIFYSITINGNNGNFKITENQANTQLTFVNWGSNLSERTYKGYIEALAGTTYTVTRVSANSGAQEIESTYYPYN